MNGILKRIITRALNLALSAAMVFIGYAATAHAQDKIKGGSLAGMELVFHQDGDWAQLDFSSKQINYQGAGVISMVLDTLLTYSMDSSGKYVLTPYVATSWDVRPDSITFTIRKDVVCEDGTPVTPTVVKNSYERTFANSPYTTALWGRSKKTVSADDAAGTVTFSFSEPNNRAINGFADQRQGIICPAQLADIATFATRPAGSGPYLIQEATHGNRIVFTKKKDWKWGPLGITSETLPDKVTFRVVENPTTAATLLLNGELDLARISPDNVARVEAARKFIKTTAVAAQTDQMYYNHKDGHPTKELAVRKALSSAFDINQFARASGRIATQSYVTERMDCYDATTAELLPKNPGPATARKILEEAGYKAGPGGFMAKDGVPLVINFVTLAGNFQSGPDYLIHSWQQAGIKVNALVADFVTFAQRLRSGNFDAFTGLNPIDVPSPSFNVYVFNGPTPPEGGQNYGYNDNKEALEAISRALAAKSTTEACKEWSAVQYSVHKNFNIFPIGSQKREWFSNGLVFMPWSTLPDIRFMRKAQQ